MTTKRPFSMYRLLALDIDGTLVNDQKEITAHTTEVLLRAQGQGLRIAIASGRPPEGIASLAGQLRLCRYGGFVMAFNGGAIVDCAAQTVIYERLLDTEVYRHLYERGNTGDFRILSYVDGHIACEDIENEYVKHTATRNRMPLMKIGSFLDVVTFPEPKCIIVGNPDKLEHLEKELVSYYNGRVSIYRSEPFFLEILPQGVDKARCLRLLVSRLGIGREEVMACGDGFNDVGMIQYAGLGVAMANAQQAVKDVADYVTLSNVEDGVAAAVEKFVLKG